MGFGRTPRSLGDRPAGPGGVRASLSVSHKTPDHRSACCGSDIAAGVL